LAMNSEEILNPTKPFGPWYNELKIFVHRQFQKKHERSGRPLPSHRLVISNHHPRNGDEEDEWNTLNHDLKTNSFVPLWRQNGIGR
jgi:hypothetical protein